ncbi:hypothetical protein F53441_13940 [Fusarium austroafricanum]|uniref:Uncharacterized protein n=1 Tax=Fusarium austroafricanum TaxID=2364996 RepID=A0A8H4JIL3_9HYPO|nr:hypothetical protein F53441_13940 [Fusarium austroafricanum]
MVSKSNSSPEPSTWEPVRMTRPDTFLMDLSHEEDAKSNGRFISILENCDLNTRCVSVSENSFVWSAIHAYRHNLTLVVRPDEVWLAILAQLGPCLIKYSKSAEMQSSGYDIPMITLEEIRDARIRAREMKYHVERKLLRPDVKDVLIPRFSKTTYVDITAAAVLLLGNPCEKDQRNVDFKYENSGKMPYIKSVDVQGTEADWAVMITRLSKIQRWDKGTELAEFASRLIPIIQRISVSLKRPHSAQASEFWGSMVKKDWGSTSNTITGWLSAFCFWDSNGDATDPDNKAVEVDGVLCWRVKYKRIPLGFASMPIKLIDQGCLSNCTMIGGMTSIWSSKWESSGAEDDPGSDTVDPIPAWILYWNNKNGTAEQEQPDRSRRES